MEFPQEPFLGVAREYSSWLGDIKPRTCLLMHWLSDLGAVPDPGDPVRYKAKRFAEKRGLLGHMVEEYGGDAFEKTGWLVRNGELDTYVAWLMWLRFQEYVPGRFVTPVGREKVLEWVRTQLRRPELNDEETIGELRWQVDRLRKSWGESRDDLHPKFE
ncbi:hypothetical protein EON80_02620 [bacterium]|nr:MAG: hypothetical protein EON80_02620 [bacterium]